MLNNTKVIHQTPCQFFERRSATLFGNDSKVLIALDLVKKEMCIEKGFKRDDGQDYYNHCVEVANTLINFQIKDENAIIAALLHDLVEDVEGYTIESISFIFNPIVGEYVRLLTKIKEYDYKNPKVITEYLDNISKNMFSSAIKTADRMHNMMTLQLKTFESKNQKCIETETYYLEFFNKCRKMYPRYESLFHAARSQIQPMIFEVKSFYSEIIRQQNEIDSLEKELIQKEKKIEELKNKLNIK